MDDVAVKLRCLELAIEQAKRENATDFKETVAELQTWLYNRIVNSPDEGKEAAKPSPKKRQV